MKIEKMFDKHNATIIKFCSKYFGECMITISKLANHYKIQLYSMYQVTNIGFVTFILNCNFLTFIFIIYL